MKKILLITSLLVPYAFSQAEVISPSQALLRLENSAKYNSISRSTSKAPQLYKVIDNLYVFNRGEGFLILPNNDLSPALLGYADTDTFSELNPALADWLSFYNQELDYLNKSNSQKRELSSSDIVRHVNRPEIEPLIKTEWNQEWPYNIDCPTVDGQESVTGCVATAMAQAMKFYDFPERGKGKHSYYWGRDKDTLSFDYDSHPFKWDLMADRYDKDTPYDQRAAVAELMFACGVSVDMYYGPGESGAATSTMGTQLIDIFGYSPSMWLPDRGNYGLEEWENMIYESLQSGEPVLYSGNGTAGGHQFICDGYSSDGFFHFNWGWGGMSNGYFLLTALNPADLGVGGGAGGFNSGQHALLGFRPAHDNDSKVYLVTNGEAFRSVVSEVREGENFKCTGSFFNYSLYKLPEDTHLGMKFMLEDQIDAIYVQGPGMGNFNPYDGRMDDEVRFPKLEDGTYIITPALHADNKWWSVKGPIGYSDNVRAVVKDGVATITNEADAEIEVIDILTPATVYINHDFPLEFSVKNMSESEYYSDITPYVVDKDGQEIASSLYRPVDVVSGETLRVTDYIAKFSALKDKTLSVGTYTLFFKNRWGKNLNTGIDISFEEAPAKNEIQFNDFKLLVDNPISEPEKAKFAIKIICDQGYYYGAPHMDLFHGDGGDDIYSVSGDKVYLTSGESAVSEFKADLSKFDDGNYIAVVYDEGRQVSDLLHFSIKRLETGTTAIDEDANLPTIYTLQGIKVEDKPTPGVYIINNRLTILK